MKPALKILALAALLAGLAAPALAAGGDVHTGTGWPIDGDSLFVIADDGTRTEIRLFGVSAPEWDHPDGPFATRLLHRLVFGRQLTCTERNRDRYKRVVAVCAVEETTGDWDVGYNMILMGYATPYRKYLAADPDLAARYFAAEGIACTAGDGVWRDQPVDDICR